MLAWQQYWHYSPHLHLFLCATSNLFCKYSLVNADNHHKASCVLLHVVAHSDPHLVGQPKCLALKYQRWFSQGLPMILSCYYVTPAQHNIRNSWLFVWHETDYKLQWLELLDHPRLTANTWKRPLYLQFEHQENKWKKNKIKETITHSSFSLRIINLFKLTTIMWTISPENASTIYVI